MKVYKAFLCSPIINAHIHSAYCLNQARFPTVAPPSSTIKDLASSYPDQITLLLTPLGEVDNLERRLADLVNNAYCLAAEEMTLRWEIAPPRMPGSQRQATLLALFSGIIATFLLQFG